MKNNFSKYTVTTDVTFCKPQGQGSLGANVCLSFDNAKYIRIEFLKDMICFSPTLTVADDGCFYSHYVRQQMRFFIPKPFIDGYRTTDGKELIDNKAERIIIDNGYAVKVNRIKDFLLNDFGISFENKELPDKTRFTEKGIFTYKTRVSSLLNDNILSL